MIRTHDRIVCSLPYPTKIVGLTVNIPRKIGFLFTNKASFLFRYNHGLKTREETKKWVDQNGGLNVFLAEMFYWAAIAYCEAERKPDNFTKAGLTVAFNIADESTKKAILEVWQSSEMASKEDKKKVKPTPKKSR